LARGIERAIRRPLLDWNIVLKKNTIGCALAPPFWGEVAAPRHSKNQGLLKDKSSLPQRPSPARPPIVPKRESGAHPRRD
jgi:hypothetical protein